jgi:hypothetical protein
LTAAVLKADADAAPEPKLQVCGVANRMRLGPRVAKA